MASFFQRLASSGKGDFPAAKDGRHSVLSVGKSKSNESTVAERQDSPARAPQRHAFSFSLSQGVGQQGAGSSRETTEDAEWETLLINTTHNDYMASLSSIQRLIEQQQRVIQLQREEIQRLRQQQLVPKSPTFSRGTAQTFTRSQTLSFITTQTFRPTLQVSISVAGEVLGHEDALRQAVGQNIASKGLRLVAPTGTEPPQWLLVVHAITTQLDVTGLIAKLRSLQGESKVLVLMHDVPVRTANSARRARDLPINASWQALEDECTLIVDILHDGSTWIDCQPNTDAICGIAERLCATRP